jgi:hypothetical protein
MNCSQHGQNFRGPDKSHGVSRGDESDAHSPLLHVSQKRHRSDDDNEPVPKSLLISDFYELTSDEDSVAPVPFPPIGSRQKKPRSDDDNGPVPPKRRQDEFHEIPSDDDSVAPALLPHNGSSRKRPRSGDDNERDRPPVRNKLRQEDFDEIPSDDDFVPPALLPHNGSSRKRPRSGDDNERDRPPVRCSLRDKNPRTSRFCEALMSLGVCSSGLEHRWVKSKPGEKGHTYQKCTKCLQAHPDNVSVSDFLELRRGLCVLGKDHNWKLSEPGREGYTYTECENCGEQPFPRNLDCGVCAGRIEKVTDCCKCCPNHHVFHFGCLRPWFNMLRSRKKPTTCPLCRHRGKLVDYLDC